MTLVGTADDGQSLRRPGLVSAIRLADEHERQFVGPAATGLGAVIDRGAVAVMDAARIALLVGFVSGPRWNLDWVRPHLRAATDAIEDDLIILADAQTSGGLLVVGELPGYPVIGHTVAGAGIQVR
ncbi:MAG TPA: hypothetical protein VIU11_01575 [Nakamurella sp.]